MIRVRAVLIWSFTAVLLLLPPGSYDVGAQSASRSTTVWDGVYSEVQARRGSDVYEEHCLQCHAPDLSGEMTYNPSPQLVGRPFMLRWEGKHLDELFTVICMQMPLNDPGTLKPQQCADVMAFIFKRNEFPSAGADLSTDLEALGSIEMTLQASK